MTWTIDETRVMPFLKAAHRRDLLAALRRPTPVTDPAPAMEDGTPAPATATGDGTPGPHAKSSKDFKDSKDVTDGAWTPTGSAVPLTARPAERTETMAAGTDAGCDDVLTVLRASRASRFLRERGLVI
ncbi:hypothetical protein [Streptomyces sp. NPDC017673]|uniref:hypothetical protein n=1 Tax=unclassified Streptomyces TaxID=2593676 RepID=UPI0037AD39F8